MGTARELARLAHAQLLRGRRWQLLGSPLSEMQPLGREEQRQEPAQEQRSRPCSSSSWPLVRPPCLRRAGARCWPRGAHRHPRHIAPLPTQASSSWHEHQLLPTSCVHLSLMASSRGRPPAWPHSSRAFATEAAPKEASSSAAQSRGKGKPPGGAAKSSSSSSSSDRPLDPVLAAELRLRPSRCAPVCAPWHCLQRRPCGHRTKRTWGRPHPPRRPQVPAPAPRGATARNDAAAGRAALLDAHAQDPRHRPHHLRSRRHVRLFRPGRRPRHAPCSPPHHAKGPLHAAPAAPFARPASALAPPRRAQRDPQGALTTPRHSTWALLSSPLSQTAQAPGARRRGAVGPAALPPGAGPPDGRRAGAPLPAARGPQGRRAGLGRHGATARLAGARLFREAGARGAAQPGVRVRVHRARCLCACVCVRLLGQRCGALTQAPRSPLQPGRRRRGGALHAGAGAGAASRPQISFEGLGPARRLRRWGGDARPHWNPDNAPPDDL